MYIVQCTPAGISEKRSCVCSLSAKAIQLRCVFMRSIRSIKKHLVHGGRNLHYLLIYTGSESFIDVLLLTPEIFLYRNPVEQPLSKSNKMHASAWECRDEELLAVVCQW